MKQSGTHCILKQGSSFFPMGYNNDIKNKNSSLPIYGHFLYINIVWENIIAEPILIAKEITE